MEKITIFKKIMKTENYSEELDEDIEEAKLLRDIPRYGLFLQNDNARYLCQLKN